MTRRTDTPYVNYSYPEYNITIIDFDSVFKYGSEQLLNTSMAYVNNYNQFNSDCKRYLLHFLILESCKHIESTNIRNTVLFVNTNFSDKPYEIFNYFNKTEVEQFVFNQFTKIRNMLPFIVHIVNEPIDFLQDQDGELIDHLHQIQNKIRKRAPNTKGHRQLLKFAQNAGLVNIADNFVLSNSFKKLQCSVA